MRFVSACKREEFVFNYTRHTINIVKRNHNFRTHEVIGLARLDIDGPPHRNPDGQEIGPSHLHLYREGFQLKWALEIPQDLFPNFSDPAKTFEDFLRYCNAKSFPALHNSLF